MTIVGSAAAQRTMAVTPNGPGWTPRIVNMNGGNATAAEKAYALARLEEIESILLKVPEIAHPDFRIREDFSGFVRSPKPNTILEYRLQLVAQTARVAMSTQCVIFEVIVNQAPPGSSYLDELGREVIFEGTFGTQRPDANVVWHKLLPPPDPSYEYVVFTRDDESPWTPVTREEFRRWQILDAEGKNGEKRLAYRQLREKTLYERFVEEAPKRKKERDEVAAALKMLKTPAEVDALIKEMEAAERQAEADLKAADAEERQKNQEQLREAWIGDKLRASIAAMSPAERKLPAFILPRASDLLFDLGTAADTPFVSRISYNNPDFWRARRSRVEVRSVTVNFEAVCGRHPPPPEAHRALWALYQKIDWAALKKLVDLK
jgi:hypothetical protein